MPPGIRLSSDEAVNKLRMFIGDNANDNKLIPGEELSSDKLKLAIDLCVDEFNNAPPFTTFTLSDFPSLMVLLHGATVQCLIMAGMIQSRNYLQFSDGGISEVLGDKAPQYQGWINQLSGILGNYKKTSSDIKVAINMEQGFGVIQSPYGYFWGNGWRY